MLLLQLLGISVLVIVEQIVHLSPENIPQCFPWAKAVNYTYKWRPEDVLSGEILKLKGRIIKMIIMFLKWAYFPVNSSHGRRSAVYC